MTWPWKFGGNDFLFIAFPSFMCPFNKTTHTSQLSSAFGTHPAPCKSSSGQIFPTNAFTREDQWHIMLYRDGGSKCILLFNKQQENYRLNQYVQQNACSFATDSGYFWRFLCSFSYILFSELTHENPRTEMRRPQSSHSVWEAFSLVWRMVHTFHHRLNNKPSSRPRSREEAPCSDIWQVSSLSGPGPLHGRRMYVSQASVRWSS